MSQASTSQQTLASMFFNQAARRPDVAAMLVAGPDGKFQYTPLPFTSSLKRIVIVAEVQSNVQGPP
ncbi:MAG: hypothetical protein AAF497_28475, partial [Planctomycetota bacterium]